GGLRGARLWAAPGSTRPGGSRRGFRNSAVLQVEQPALGVEPAEPRIAAEFHPPRLARAADDAMAGDEDWNRVGRVGLADGSGRSAHLGRDLAVAPREAGRNTAERLPNTVPVCRPGRR